MYIYIYIVGIYIASCTDVDLFRVQTHACERGLNLRSPAAIVATTISFYKIIQSGRPTALATKIITLRSSNRFCIIV